MVRKFIIVLWLALAAGLTQAGEAVPLVEDPALEARVQKISEVLRCLVCQNQNLADSHADLAMDLKNQVRDMLKRGQSEKEVIDFMVARYGDFVLYKPPVKSTTWLLWGGPFALFAGALGFLFVKLNRRRKNTAAPLSAEERARAASLLDGEGRKGA